MCVYYTGASEIQPSIKNEAFSEKSKQVLTIFGKKLNLRHSTWSCETPLHSPGYLYCFIVSHIGYISKDAVPGYYQTLKGEKIRGLHEQVDYSRFSDLKLLNSSYGD